jgi:hypothetical protein
MQLNPCFSRYVPAPMSVCMGLERVDVWTGAGRVDGASGWGAVVRLRKSN